LTIAIELLNSLLPVLYALCAAAYLLLFLKNDPLVQRIAPRMLTITLALHLADVTLRVVALRHIPLASIYEALTMIALALALVYKVIERSEKMPFTGVFVVTMAFVCQTVSSALINHTGEINEILRSPWFGVHTTTAVVGYVAFAVSAIYGVLYVMLYHDLKSRQFGVVYERLPSLEVLAQMNYRATLVGFWLLTLAIAVGIMWSFQAFGSVAWGDPKMWTTVAIWLAYAVYLIARHVAHWSRLRLVYVSLVGFGLVAISMLVVNALVRSFHSFT
jgi:ABC-type transport system involved in cytochrome c biogenesis permease subunit